MTDSRKPQPRPSHPDHPRESVIKRVGNYEILQIKQVLVQANFKFFLKTLKLSRRCLKYVKHRLGDDFLINVKMRFFHFRDNISKPRKVKKNKVPFNINVKYKMNIDIDFVLKLAQNPLNLQVVAVRGSEELLIAEIKYFIANLHLINNVKQEEVIYFTNSAITHEPTTSVAILKMSYKVSSNQGFLNNIYQRAFDASIIIQPSPQLSTKYTKAVTENNDLKLLASQSMMPEDKLKEKHWMQDAAIWNKGLQEEESVVTVQKISSMDQKQLAPYIRPPKKLIVPEFTITLTKIRFLPDSPPVNNDDIHQIYVEYSFINSAGLEFETESFTIPAEGEDLLINFSRSFSIDPKTDHENCASLISMVKNDKVVRFTIFSESKEDDETLELCQEIGFADLNMSILETFEENFQMIQLEIFDFNSGEEVIGFLFVNFEGIIAVKAMLVQGV